jgi:hypothetical protein
MTTLQHDPDLARADHLLTADELRLKYFDANDRSGGQGEHPRFSKFDWHQEVASGDTLRGYWPWVEAQIEEAHDEEG